MTFYSPHPVAEDLTSALLCFKQNANDGQLYLILHHDAEDFGVVSSEALQYKSLIGPLEDFKPVERIKCKDENNPEKWLYYFVLQVKPPMGNDVNEKHIGLFIWLFQVTRSKMQPTILALSVKAQNGELYYQTTQETGEKGPLGGDTF